MAALRRVDNFMVLRQIGIALNSANFPALNLKPLQVRCLEYILRGKDVIGVLPTGFGKSFIFHLLPYFLPTKKSKNIVLVVCPLNSIIEDQLIVLKSRGIAADVLVEKGQDNATEKLFSATQGCHESIDVEANIQIPYEILNGQCSIVFTHPEALLSKEGRELMASQVYQDKSLLVLLMKPIVSSYGKNR